MRETKIDAEVSLGNASFSSKLRHLTGKVALTCGQMDDSPHSFHHRLLPP